MSTSTQTPDKPAGVMMRELSPASRNYKAWVTKAAKQPMVFETLDPGPLGDEEVEVAVEHCGLCHSDLSVFNNDWGISQFPAVLGHEVIGRITALGPNAKARRVGQRVGVGWFSMPVGKPSPLPAGSGDDHRPSRRICFARPRELGVDATPAREAELRRRRPASVRRHHCL